MITGNFFYLIKYRFNHSMKKNIVISDIIGLDTEAYENGIPFIICFSDGNIIKPELIYKVLNEEKYKNKNFGCYNLKYDSGNILFFLTDYERFDLWKYGDTTIERENKKIFITYIPHKFLSFRFNKKNTVKIWDIAQFFKMTLDSASRKYLNKSKKDIETKKFNLQYVNKNYDKIAKYCIQDSVLCSQLAHFFLESCAGFGIRCTALYSYASLSLQYFSDRTRIVDIERIYKNYSGLIEHALDAYQGGKFEVTQKGLFKNAYEYDIVSAYPYEIANLADLRFSKIIFNKQYEKNAYYGFIRCKVIIKRDFFPTAGLMEQGTRIYPIGEYHITLTKNEYEYYIENNIQVVIISAYWIFINNPVFPYKKVIDELFSLKNRYKGKDETFYSLSKYMMNSFYGKTCQMINKIKRKNDMEYLDAGRAFNPIHAAIITANTRLKVSKIQNMYKENCLAVHTDSVILSNKLPDEITGGKLGQFEYVESGQCIIVACGCYQIGDSCAFKGFRPLITENGKIENWSYILNKYHDKKEIPYTALMVQSWIETTFRGKQEETNQFANKEKNISLNKDIKRTWPDYNLTGEKLLKNNYIGSPKIMINQKPEYWI